MTTADSRHAAQTCIQELIGIARQQPPGPLRESLLAECEALDRAVAAFHLEGIRFRAFNVDRLLRKEELSLPPAAGEAFARMREHLEAAGFHTRSHQAPS